MARSDGNEEQILQRLDTLIRLLAYQVAMAHDTLETKALTLKSAGLAPADIAQICGTTPVTIRARLAEAKKTGKRQTKKKTKAQRA